MDYLALIGVVIAGYLIGSIPNGLIIGKIMYGIDLRDYGSKNIGATNAFRTLGIWPAFWVFLTDALKGVLGVLIGQFYVGTPAALLAGGIASITGHNWSLFLNFKGGRGVATGLGVITVLVPSITGVVLLVWSVIVYLTRYVSLASVVAAMLVPVLMLIMHKDYELLLFGILAAVFVVVRHIPNIKRLLKGEELKIKVGNIDSTTKDEH